MIAALILAASLTAPSTLGAPGPARVVPVADRAPAAHVVVAANTPAADPNAPDHKPTFLEQYLSYELSPQALPVVKDGQVMSFVLGYLLYGICGSLWGPLVAIEGASLDGDVVGTWFLSTLIWGVVSTAASVTIVGGALFLALPYLSTMATLNAIDRQMKKKGFKAPAPGSPSQPGQPPPADQPPPSYAY